MFERLPSERIYEHLETIDEIARDAEHSAKAEAKRRIDEKIAEILRKVFVIWREHIWTPPEKRWENFRKVLASGPQRIGATLSQWKIDEMRKNIALGTAIRCIDKTGETVLVPDAGLALVHGEDSFSEALETDESGSDVPENVEEFAYIDWARTWSGFVDDKENEKNGEAPRSGSASRETQPETHFTISRKDFTGRSDATVDGAIAITLKDKLNALARSRAVGSAFLTPVEAMPIAYWLKNLGEIEMAVDADGIVAICLKLDGDLSGSSGKQSDKSTAVRADNVATILAHFMRRALGDHVAAGEPKELAASEEGIVYAIAPDEVLPVAVDPVDGGAKAVLSALTTTPEAEEDRPKRKGKRLVNMLPKRRAHGPLRAREHWTGDTAHMPRAAAVALAERGVSRRNALFGAIESLKRFELNDQGKAGRNLSGHAALFAAIPLLMGLFFGAIFAETIADVLIGRLDFWWGGWPSLTILLVVVGSVGAWLCVWQFRLLHRKYHHKPEMARPSRDLGRPNGSVCEPSVLLYGLGGLLLGFAVAAFPVDEIRSFIFLSESEGIQSVKSKPTEYFYSINLVEVGVLGWFMALISAFVFFFYMRFDDRMQNELSKSLFGAEHEDVSTSSSRVAKKLRDKDRMLFFTMALWVPLAVLAVIMLLKTTDFLGNLLEPATRESDGAQYRPIFVSLAWAMPVLGFGVLVSTWNRFGNTGLTTLGHQLAMRRLKQAESLIREYEPLAALLARRNKGLHFADIEKAANAVAPQADLVKAHEARTEARFVRSTALVAAIVVALLQIDAFESLKPEGKKVNHTVETWLRDAVIHAFAKSDSGGDTTGPSKQLSPETEPDIEDSARDEPGLLRLASLDPVPPPKDSGKTMQTGDGTSPTPPQDNDPFGCGKKPKVLTASYMKKCFGDPEGQSGLGKVLDGMRSVHTLTVALQHLGKDTCPSGECDEETAKVHRGLQALLERPYWTGDIVVGDRSSFDWATVAGLVDTHTEGDDIDALTKKDHDNEAVIAREILRLRTGALDWKHFCEEVKGKLDARNMETSPDAENPLEINCNISIGGPAPPQEDRAAMTAGAFAALLLPRSSGPSEGPDRGLDRVALAKALDGSPQEGADAENALAGLLSEIKDGERGLDSRDLEPLKELLAWIAANERGLRPKDLNGLLRVLRKIEAGEQGLDRDKLLAALREEKAVDTGAEEERAADADTEVALAEMLRSLRPPLPPPPPTGTVANALFPPIPENCGGKTGGKQTVARIFFPFGKASLEPRGTEKPRYCIQEKELSESRLPEDCTAMDNPAAFQRELRETVRERIGDRQDLSHLLVVGFADMQGVPIGNVALSQDRARTVKAALGGGTFARDGGSPLSVVDIGRGEEPGAQMIASGTFRSPDFARRVEVRLCRQETASPVTRGSGQRADSSGARAAGTAEE